jgi:hypothetical protein
MTSATQPTLDRQAVLARLGGNARLLEEVAAILLEDCPGWLAGLAAALRRGDARALAFTAHLLRGSVSGALGRCAAYDLAGELEALARAESLGPAAEVYATRAEAVRGLEPPGIPFRHQLGRRHPLGQGVAVSPVGAEDHVVGP